MKQNKIQQRNYCSIKQTLPGGCCLRGTTFLNKTVSLPDNIFLSMTHIQRGKLALKIKCIMICSSMFPQGLSLILMPKDTSEAHLCRCCCSPKESSYGWSQSAAFSISIVPFALKRKLKQPMSGAEPFGKPGIAKSGKKDHSQLLLLRLILLQDMDVLSQ